MWTRLPAVLYTMLRRTFLAPSSACTPAVTASHTRSAASDCRVGQHSRWVSGSSTGSSQPLPPLPDAPCGSTDLRMPTCRAGFTHLLALQHVVVQHNLVDGDADGHWSLDPLEALVHRMKRLLVQPVVRPAVQKESRRAQSSKLGVIRPTCVILVTCFVSTENGNISHMLADRRPD